MWNISTVVCDKTIKLDGGVEALELLPNGHIACLTLYGLLYFWNAVTDYLSHAVVIDKYRCNWHMIQLDSGDLCICSDRSTEITIWDYQTYQKLKTVSVNLYAGVFASWVLLRDGRVAIGVLSTETILLYNLETGECEQELQDTCATRIVQLSDDRLCCGGLYYTVWK
jgi:hypothetical protein